MADVKVKTSERPRWDINELIAHPDDGWDPAPEEMHFLGGSRDGDGDYDLYLFVWEDGDRAVVAARKHRGKWEQFNEVLKEVSDNSYEILLEAQRRALSEGLVPDDNPRDEVEDCADDNRSDISDDVGGRDHNADAVFLGGSRVQGTIFELYVVPKDDKLKGHKGDPKVYAISTSSDVKNEEWWSDGSLPDNDTIQHIALREAIRRALAQGFDFDADEDALKEAQSNDHSAPVGPGRKTEESQEPKGTTALMSKQVTKFTNVTVADSHDEQIHLPKGMSKAQAREWLTQIERNEEQVIQWSDVIDAYPLDGALALNRVLARRFGGAVRAGATGWWGEEIPPFMVAVEVGFQKTSHVPWGHFTIPLMPEHKIHAGTEMKEKQLFFKLSGEIKRKYQPMMDEIAAQVRDEVKLGSIYKGQAFRLKFPTDAETKERGYDPNDFAPHFINPQATRDQLVLSEVVQEQVETNLFTPVECTDMCRAQKVPLKRGVLLEGKYGTGKTLTAEVLAALCVEFGWTYIYLQNIADLEKAMRFAKRYEPAVIFAEDIDAVMKQKEGSVRDAEMNKILNTIDGVDMKQAEQMVVLTSNFVDRINKAMIRPGRLDAVIEVAPPDEKAVLKLFRRYAAGLLDKESDESILPAAKLLSGQIPSVVREVVERSKLASIRRSKREGSKTVNLKGSDLLVAANGMMTHIKLLEEPAADLRSDIEKAASVVATAIVSAAGSHSSTTNGSSGKSAPASKPKVAEAKPA